MPPDPGPAMPPAPGTPSSRAIVQAWEWGEPRHPVDRALLLLDLAQPGADWADLAALSVGRRNARLLDLRAVLFGPVMPCFVTCPACSAALELALPARALRGAELPPPRPSYELLVEGIALRVRLPDSHDLAALVGLTDLEQARRHLIRRCVLDASRDGAPVTVESLPASVLAALADELHALEPPAALLLGLTCADCGHAWSASLDIAAYLWTELSGTARRLLRDVHELASAYSWPEDAILAMSDTRRQHYLELIRA